MKVIEQLKLAILNQDYDLMGNIVQDITPIKDYTFLEESEEEQKRIIKRKASYIVRIHTMAEEDVL